MLIHLYTVYDCLNTLTTDECVAKEIKGLVSQKYSLAGPLQKDFTNLTAKGECEVSPS
jgi:hypothetical protein